MRNRRFRAPMLAAVLVIAACVDVTFVEIEDARQPAPPSMYAHLNYGVTGANGRFVYVSASFSRWGAVSPGVSLEGGRRVVLPPLAESGRGDYRHGIQDTLEADSPAQLYRLAFTPPGRPDLPPIVVGLPRVQSDGLVVCPDSADGVALAMRVEGAADSADVFWAVTVSSVDAEIQHHATWSGNGQPLVRLPVAVLPEGDTVRARFRVSIHQSLAIDDSVRVSTSTDVEEEFRIVKDAVTCSSPAGSARSTSSP